MPYLFILFMCFLLTGCASTSVCPGNAEHQQFTQRSSQLTISRCKTDNLYHGPYTERLGKQVRLKGQYNAKGQRTGKWTRFANNGAPTHTFAFDQNGKLHGEEVTYIESKIVTRVSWVHGKKHGQMCLYHPSVAKKSCGQYVDDKPMGQWPVWDEQGKQVFTNVFGKRGTEKYWRFGNRNYHAIDRSNPNRLVSTVYRHKGNQIISVATSSKCPTGWCRRTSTIYFTQESNKLYKTPQEDLVFEPGGQYATDRLTNKRTRQMCNIHVLIPTLTTQLQTVTERCARHPNPTGQRNTLVVKTNEVGHILDVRYRSSSSGVTEEHARCLKKNIATLKTAKPTKPKGICMITFDLIATSPLKSQIIRDGNYVPSH